MSQERCLHKNHKELQAIEATEKINQRKKKIKASVKNRANELRIHETEQGSRAPNVEKVSRVRKKKPVKHIHAVFLKAWRVKDEAKQLPLGQHLRHY